MNKNGPMTKEEMKHLIDNDKTILSIEKKILQLQEQKLDRERKLKDMARSSRTHRLCTIGGDVEAILGHRLDTKSDEYQEFLKLLRELKDKMTPRIVSGDDDELWKLGIEDNEE